MTNRHSFKPLLLAIPCLFALFIYVFPNFVRPVLPGFDNSWKYAINFAAANSLTFGRDLTFTYGPLGYLLMPVSLGTNLYWGAVFQVTAYLLFFGQLAYLIGKNQTPLAKVIFFSGLFGLMAQYFPLNIDVVLMLIMTIFFYQGLTADSLRGRILATIAGAAIAAACAFFKFNLGLAGFGTVIIFCGYLLYQRTSEAKRVMLLTSGTYVFSLLAFSALLIGSFWATIDFFRYSFVIADGHSVAMSWVENYTPQYQNMMYGDEVVTGLLVVAGFLASLLLLWKKGEKSHYLLLVALATLFLAFKQGYVRQGCGFFFSFNLGLLATTLLVTKAASAWNWLLAITMIVTVLNSGLSLTYGVPTPKTAMNGRQGLSNFVDFCELPQTVAEAEKLSAVAAESARLPKEIEAAFDQRNSNWKRQFTFDAIPTEFTALYANDLNWRPSPFLQFYMLYSPVLDEKAASHFAGANKPDYILVGWSVIDFRNLVTDAPQTWKSISANYQYVGSFPNYLLLQARPIPVQKLEIPIASEPLRFETWLQVPDTTDLLFVKSRLQLTAYGKLRKFFFRIPPVYLVAEYENGQINLIRLPPENMVSGFLINYLPPNQQYLATFYEGKTLPRVRHILFTGPGLNYYTAEEPLVWYKAVR